MRVFKTKWFARFAQKESISDQKLAEAVREVEKGLHDGDLGGGLLKKRLARAGKGKSGGYRTIIVYHKGKRAVFVYGFPKSATENMSPVELREYQKSAQIFLRFSEADMEHALRTDEVKEVEYDGKEVSQ